MSNGQRVLITGINGFTGQYLRAELAGSGWEVYGIGRMDDPSRCRDIDLLDSRGISDWISAVRPDAVVHLAGIAFVGHGNPDAFYQVNLIGTRHLLEALATLDPAPSCVLLASSANVYGNASGGALAESWPPHPANDYAVSKLAMEYLARLWCDRLPIVVVRPFNYTGVGQSEAFLLPKIVAHFRCGAASIELGNLDVWRDFSDVRAVVRAYRRLLEVKPAGETVNVCSGRTHSLREVIGMAEALSGRTIEVRVNPAFVRSSEVASLCGDPTLLRQLIGAWDTPPLQETLGWMLDAGS